MGNGCDAVSRVLNMQAKRAANRAARRSYALNGPAERVEDRNGSDAYLKGYFRVLDGHKVSLKDLPQWKPQEGLQEYRNRLWQFSPYLAGAWAATRALELGFNLKGYQGRVSCPCELDRLDAELRRREKADAQAAMEREGFMRVISQDASDSPHSLADDVVS